MLSLCRKINGKYLMEKKALKRIFLNFVHICQRDDKSLMHASGKVALTVLKRIFDLNVVHSRLAVVWVPDHQSA